MYYLRVTTKVEYLKCAFGSFISLESFERGRSGQSHCCKCLYRLLRGKLLLLLRITYSQTSFTLLELINAKGHVIQWEVYIGGEGGRGDGSGDGRGAG